MKWERGHRSKNVEDARGERPPRGGGALKVGGGGAILLALIALIAKAAGVDSPGLDSATSSSPATSSGADPGGGSGAPAGPTGPDPDAELVEFINYVIDDIQGTFAKVFAAEGHTYQDAKLRIFTEAVATGCGRSSAAIGPFYCPPDQKAYIDLSFYRELKQRFGAPGDFAQAYVLAHELGHHAQNLLGTNARVERESRRDRSRENELSVRLELQADCYAGVWAHSTQQRKLIEAGDIQESLDAAAAIGDDRLQQMGGGEVNPETWTHGSSAQRVRWFKRGLEQGTLAACDTFGARDL